MGDPIPYREGEPAPGPPYILANLQDEDGSVRKVWIDSNELSKGPVKHESLGPLLPVVRWQWRHLQSYATWCRSFEDWELDFLRDENPGSEISVWSRITYALLEFVHRNPRVDPGQVFGALASISNGQAEHVKPTSVAETLQTLFNDPPAELSDVHNFTEGGDFRAGGSHLC